MNTKREDILQNWNATETLTSANKTEKQNLYYTD